MMVQLSYGDGVLTVSFITLRPSSSLHGGDCLNTLPSERLSNVGCRNGENVDQVEEDDEIGWGFS
jgi:hypothetical protein